MLQNHEYNPEGPQDFGYPSGTIRMPAQPREIVAPVGAYVPHFLWRHDHVVSLGDDRCAPRVERREVSLRVGPLGSRFAKQGRLPSSRHDSVDKLVNGLTRLEHTIRFELLYGRLRRRWTLATAARSGKPQEYPNVDLRRGSYQLRAGGSPTAPGHARPRSDVWLEVSLLQALLRHAKANRIDRCSSWKLELTALPPLDQGLQNLQLV